MYKTAVIRLLLLLIIGSGLRYCLSYISGRIEPIHLKKRLKHRKNISRRTLKIITCIYLLALLTVLILVYEAVNSIISAGR